MSRSRSCSGVGIGGGSSLRLRGNARGGRSYRTVMGGAGCRVGVPAVGEAGGVGAVVVPEPGDVGCVGGAADARRGGEEGGVLVVPCAGVVAEEAAGFEHGGEEDLGADEV